MYSFVFMTWNFYNESHFLVTDLCRQLLFIYLFQARGYLQSLPFKPKVPWTKLYPNADPKGRSRKVFAWLKYFISCTSITTDVAEATRGFGDSDGLYYKLWYLISLQH